MRHFEEVGDIGGVGVEKTLLGDFNTPSTPVDLNKFR